MSKTFSYLKKPIAECGDKELILWYIAFCNGADLNDEENQREYKEFKEELANRSEAFKADVAYIDSVL